MTTMKQSVYIESSVISYSTARPSRDVVIAVRQAVTRDWWENHRHRGHPTKNLITNHRLETRVRRAMEQDRMDGFLDVLREMDK